MTVQRDGLNRRKGMTLLFTLGILTLLSVFAVAFVRLVNFERAASANYTEGVRARLVARAGLARAVAEIRKMAQVHHYSDPRADGWEFRYIPPAKDGGRGANLLTTITPSFATRDTKRALFGSYLMSSGQQVSASHNGGTDVYKLKIIDASSQLNLNHPDWASLVRMVKHLLLCASELDPGNLAAVPERKTISLSAPRAEEIAKAIVGVDAASQRRFTSVSEVRPLLLAADPANAVTWERWWLEPGDQADTSRQDDEAVRPPLRDLFTVGSWVDPKVIRPWHLNGDVAGTAGIRDLPLLARAPINLNTASVPVLTAILADIRAVNTTFLRVEVPYSAAKLLAIEIAKRVRPSYGTPSQNYSTTISDPATPPAMRPFRTWLEFERWLDNGAATAEIDDAIALCTQTINGGRMNVARSVGALISNRKQGVRDLIKAQLNPNTMISKFGIGANHGGSQHPLYPLPRLVDKSDIQRMTTEGCFDGMGVYDITSLGMVLTTNEREGTATPELMVLASQTIQTTVRIYDVVRLTNQADFENNRALFATGDYLQAYDRNWSYKILGVNRPAYGPKPSGVPIADLVTADDPGTPKLSPGDPGYRPAKTMTTGYAPGFQGWPGMISYPVYSLHRAAPEENGTLAPGYDPALWDGCITLSNLLASATNDIDFVVCFARGSTEAFKVRAWWDPRDQDRKGLAGGATANPNGSGGIHPGNPAAGKSKTPSHPKNDVELSNLATAKGRAIETGGAISKKANPLDTVPGRTASDAKWFFDGSSLTNNGVMISPDRVAHDAQGDPILVAGQPLACSLAYDGDNINLNNGGSIRFWVQPLGDPFLRSEEVLFSWVGSRTGVDRNVGFRCVKQVRGTRIYIVLQTFDLEDSNRGGYFGFPQERFVEVTPRASAEGTAPQPLKPEWTPNSWHWIVINFGAYAMPNSSDPDALPGPRQQWTIQVDKARSDFIYEDIARPQTKTPYGEIHAAATVGGHSNYVSTTHELLAGKLDPNGRVWWVYSWRGDRFLGDWYNANDGMNPSYGSTAKSKTINNGIVWFDAGPGNGNGNGNANGNNGDDGIEVGGSGTAPVLSCYVVANAPLVPDDPDDIFPPGAYDRALSIEFVGRTGTNNVIQMQSPSGPNATWSYNFKEADFGTDKKPHTDDDFPMNIIATWKEATYTSDPCAYCVKHDHCVDGAMIWGNNPVPAEIHIQEGSGSGDSGSSGSGSTGHGGENLLGIHCYMSWTGSLNTAGASSAFPPPNDAPLLTMQYICDQCNGCENSDVDGIMFFGAEPVDLFPLRIAGALTPDYRGDKNSVDMNGDGTPDTTSEVNMATMANAVFDNIIIKNNRERRTDWTDGNTVKGFEDRFYETTLSTLAAKAAEIGVAGVYEDFGAVYRRGLVELQGTRYTLGSLSWTTYPTSFNAGPWPEAGALPDQMPADAAQQFDVTMLRLPGGDDSLRARFRRENTKIGTHPFPTTARIYANTGSIAKVTNPHVKPYTDGSVPIGFGFRGEPVFDCTADPNHAEGEAPFAKEILVLQVRVKDKTTATDPAAIVPTTETPALEDITLTLIRESPQFLYAEEGVEE